MLNYQRVPHLINNLRLSRMNQLTTANSTTQPGFSIVCFAEPVPKAGIALDNASPVW